MDIFCIFALRNVSGITEYKLEMCRNSILKKGKPGNKSIIEQNIMLIVMCFTGNYEGCFPLKK